jgi:hypothetical protein
MSSIEVRSFRRGDREQLTRLVNVHAAAVIPGMSGARLDRVLDYAWPEESRSVTRSCGKLGSENLRVHNVACGGGRINPDD